ncbi:hypothetical protein EWM64_g3091 [Hericium alpestre]|uniref:Amino acid permease/ SLC12A domain-containing protein n=1 Tax=Hericium alpestre TaxID=135208 RepID=A0A4Z0A1G5_9AGAM|nr:hypothetical protein EWM64_g3091 [Hericium alpestre]
MGYITATASVSWGLAVQVMAAVSMGTDSAFEPTAGQIYGIFVASLALQGVLCSSSAKYIARIQNLFTLINFLLCIVMIVGLPIATPHEFKNTAQYTFGHFEKSTGWPDGFAFILSFLAPLWTLSGLDGSVHISEEASNASIAVPATIIGATIVGGVLGWAINVAVAFNMGTDLAALIDNPIGQPMATILMNSFGKTGALVIWVFVILTQFMIGVNVVIVASRQAYAFSRDGALLFSRFIRRINGRTHTPVVAVWFVITVAMVVGLLAFAGPAAVNAIFSLGVVGFFLADSIPISARFLGKNEFRPGPFTLGKFGLPVAVVAVLWMWFMIIILMFPPSPNPTATTMNYIVVVSGSVILLSLTYYFCPKYGGRYWFKGPIRTVDDSVMSDESTSVSQDGDPEKEAGEKYDGGGASGVVV